MYKRHLKFILLIPLNIEHDFEININKDILKSIFRTNTII